MSQMYLLQTLQATTAEADNDTSSLDKNIVRHHMYNSKVPVLRLSTAAASKHPVHEATLMLALVPKRACDSGPEFSLRSEPRKKATSAVRSIGAAVSIRQVVETCQCCQRGLTSTAGNGMIPDANNDDDFKPAAGSLVDPLSPTAP